MGHIGTREKYTLKDGRIIIARNDEIIKGDVCIYIDDGTDRRIFYYEIYTTEYINDYGTVLKRYTN